MKYFTEQELSLLSGVNLLQYQNYTQTLFHMSFDSLGLSASILRAVAKKGYTTPSPIQTKAIPPILAGKDILASAQTGTGKTAGFTLPMLHILSQGPALQKGKIRSLILTPTRELAAQIHTNILEYSTFLDIKSAVIFGGVKQKSQVAKLSHGVDILVATPGRLLDLENQGIISLAEIEIFVLDEADRMLDMGFIRDIQRTIKKMPKRRQNLMFSATFSKEIKNLAQGILFKPAQVEATPENTAVEVITQKAYHVAKSAKTDFIISLIQGGKWTQVLVFTRTKHGANKLCKKMIAADITAVAIHGNKGQGARTRALAEFKTGEVRVLVATDIAARGLDIPLLPHVVNFELPNVAEDYVHRIGRTGRAGASGEAISLVSIDEMDYLRGIEKLIGKKIPSQITKGFEKSSQEDQEFAKTKKKTHVPRGFGRRKPEESKNKSRPGSKRYFNSRSNKNSKNHKKNTNGSRRSNR